MKNKNIVDKLLLHIYNNDPSFWVNDIYQQPETNYDMKWINLFVSIFIRVVQLSSSVVDVEARHKC